MKLIIDIDDNVFTRLFDNGIETNIKDRKAIDKAVRNGMPISKWLSSFNTESAPKCFEAVQKLKMEVENGKTENP